MGALRSTRGAFFLLRERIRSSWQLQQPQFRNPREVLDVRRHENTLLSRERSREGICVWEVVLCLQFCGAYRVVWGDTYQGQGHSPQQIRHRTVSSGEACALDEAVIYLAPIHN